MKKILVILLGIASVVYLLNPGAGVFEVLPDNLPFIGNLDEAFAAGVLVMCLKYFDIDLTRLLDRSSPRHK